VVPCGSADHKPCTGYDYINTLIFSISDQKLNMEIRHILVYDVLLFENETAEPRRRVRTPTREIKNGFFSVLWPLADYHHHHLEAAC